MRCRYVSEVPFFGIRERPKWQELGSENVGEKKVSVDARARNMVANNFPNTRIVEEHAVDRCTKDRCGTLNYFTLQHHPVAFPSGNIQVCKTQVTVSRVVNKDGKLGPYHMEKVTSCELMSPGTFG